jgi:hypothetical protein
MLDKDFYPDFPRIASMRTLQQNNLALRFQEVMFSSRLPGISHYSRNLEVRLMFNSFGERYPDLE